ncbi:MAG: DUF192 domain-containing protein [Pseudomonadota bacterium]|nr:DUF192 domain-containing protein [Pseudomonadota bacterium]
MKSLSLWVAPFCLGLLTSHTVLAQGPAAASAPLTSIALRVGGHRISAEVADTVENRTKGLMYRFNLPQDHGMVFVFAHPEPLGFWMKNTLIPLSIAFIDSTGQILNIDDMAPQTEATHPSRGPALYALEMRRGWFRDHGIKAGDRVEGLPPPAKE